MTGESYDDSYTNFVKAQANFEKGLRLILNGSGIAEKEVELLALSNTDPMVILAAAPPAIMLFCKAIQSILKTIQEGQQIVLLNQQIQTGKLKNKELESMLTQHKESSEKQALSQIASELVPNAENEERNSLEHGLRLVLQSLASGNTVEIIVGEYDKEKDSENAEADQNATKSYLTQTQMKALEVTSTELRKLKNDSVPSYLLEAPTPKISQSNEE